MKKLRLYIAKHIKYLDIVDCFLLLFMIILMAQTVYHLFIVDTIGNKGLIDTALRTTTAGLFGYYIGKGFMQDGSKIQDATQNNQSNKSKSLEEVKHNSKKLTIDNKNGSDKITANLNIISDEKIPDNKNRSDDITANHNNIPNEKQTENIASDNMNISNEKSSAEISSDDKNISNDIIANNKSIMDEINSRRNIQVAIVGSIGILALILIIITRNTDIVTVEKTPTLSQLRDFVSGSTGFLISQSRK